MGTYYKLINFQHKSNHMTGKLALDYSTDRWTETNDKVWALGYGIYIYDNLQIAKECGDPYSIFQLWEVETEEINTPPSHVAISSDIDAFKLIELLGNYKNESQQSGLQPLVASFRHNENFTGEQIAKHVFVAQRVKLTRRIL